MPPYTRRHGFTLLELLLVVAMVGVLSAVAIPRMRSTLDGIAARGAGTDAAIMLSHARQLALTRGVRTTVTIDTANGVISIRAGPTIAQTRDETLAHGVHLSATRLAVTYTQLGVALGVSNLTLVATRGAAADAVTVSRLGRVRRASD